MYPLEYKKQLKRSQIFSSFQKGAVLGVLSQFLADIIFTIEDPDLNLLTDDIQIKELPFYYASIASGAVAGVLSLYMDRFATVFFTVITYNVVFEIMDDAINKDPIEFDSYQLVFDIGVTLILLYVFDSTAKNDYVNHYYERHCIVAKKLKGDRDLFTIIFIAIITSTFSFLESTVKENNNQ